MVIELKKINNLINKIKSTNKICLFVHENPDCDAIGSAFAFKTFIEDNFESKDVRIAGLNEVDKNFILPFFNINYLPVDKDFAKESIGIIFDTSNQSRILTQLNIFCNWTFLIDHHPSDYKISNQSIIDINSSSTCELVGLMLMKLSKKYNISSTVANSLYFGILTDTNRFLYPLVAKSTFNLMSFLCDKGLNRELVHNQLYLRDFSDVELDHKLFELIQYNNEYGYATLFIDKKYNKKYNKKSFNGKVYLMANIKEIKISTLVYYDENLNKWKGSIRSREYDVSQIANLFNGGGHKLASGFILNDFKQTKQLEAKIKEFLMYGKK